MVVCTKSYRWPYKMARIPLLHTKRLAKAGSCLVQFLGAEGGCHAEVACVGEVPEQTLLKAEPFSHHAHYQ